MLNTNEILETLRMIDEEKLDVRTITMGISLFSCVSDDTRRLCDNIYDRITRKAERLVKVGEDIEKEYGVPIVNKRIAVTPAALITGQIAIPLSVAHGPGPGGQGNRRELSGRLFRPGAEGHDRSRPRPHRLHSRGAGHHRSGLLLRQRGLHPGGH